MIEETAYELLANCPDPSMKKLSEMVKLAANSRAVFISGETGTGKELVARALHEKSDRRRRKLIVVNCGNQVKELMASELFGHEKGSFTGAIRQHIGCIERAHESTLFLDEIAELPLEMQTRLLRVLESHQFTRVGGEAELHSNFSIVAASHQDLVKLVKIGKFREDLYYRINVFYLRFLRSVNVFSISNIWQSSLQENYLPERNLCRRK